MVTKAVVCWSRGTSRHMGRFLAMKRAAPPASKQRRTRRPSHKPGVKWRETDEHSSDESVLVDDRGQAQPKNYRTEQRCRERGPEAARRLTQGEAANGSHSW